MSNWKQVIGAIAPTLGTALGGPLGGLAAAVAGKILLGNDKVSAEDIKEFVVSNQNPETFLKLKQIEQEFLLELEKIGLEKEKLVVKGEEINAADRASARVREQEVRDNTNKVLAFVVIGSFSVMAYSVLFGEISVDSALAGTIVGYMSAKAEQVLSYYFGSSMMGSKMKSLLFENKEEKK